MEADGQDVRPEPLEARRKRLARLLSRSNKALRDGIQLSEAITGDGAAIFRHACLDGPRRHRLEADRLALCERPDTCLVEDEEPELRAAVKNTAAGDTDLGGRRAAEGSPGVRGTLHPTRVCCGAVPQIVAQILPLRRLRLSSFSFSARMTKGATIIIIIPNAANGSAKAKLINHFQIFSTPRILSHESRGLVGITLPMEIGVQYPSLSHKTHWYPTMQRAPAKRRKPKTHAIRQEAIGTV
jgi:hypothetical protein